MEPLELSRGLNGRTRVRSGRAPSSRPSTGKPPPGLPASNPEKVRIHTTFLGGGFGRRANPQSDFVVEAVQVAKAVGKPVKVIWTREDDIKGGYYRPMAYHRMKAALDSAGNLVAWKHTIVSQSIMKGSPFRGAHDRWTPSTKRPSKGPRPPLRHTPTSSVDLHTPDVALPVQWWRSVGHSHTAFVVETFIDELAHEAGKDPYEFRHDSLRASPAQGCPRAAEKAGWGTPLPEGRAQGHRRTQVLRQLCRPGG